MTLTIAVGTWHRDLLPAGEPQNILEPSAIDKAFLTAHLLTACTARAESAVLEAIAWWRPYHRHNDLFARTVQNALRIEGEGAQSIDNETDPAKGSLPAELQAVLGLSTPLRKCYVLRFLVGLSPEACARSLRISADEVSQNTIAALMTLLARPIGVGNLLSA